MVSTRTADLLRRLPFLRHLDDAQLGALGQQLDRLEFGAGEEILRQGTRTSALYLVVEGAGELLARRADRPPEPIAGFTAGDTLGEVDLFFGQPASLTARTSKPTVVLRWDRTHLSSFLRQHPDTLDDLRFIADSRQLARRGRFPWLAEDESIYGLARKHIAVLFWSLIPSALMLAAAMWLGARTLNGASGLLGWLGGILALAGLALAAWQWVDWSNDYYVITNRRVVWIEKIVGLYDSRQESPFHMTLAVTVSTGALGRLLGYGNVVVRTYTGQVPFRHIGRPYAAAALIEELRRRLGEEKQEEDRASLLAALKQRLEPTQSQPEPVQPQEQPAARPAETALPPALGQGAFRIRFEQGDTITYRKHWAILLASLVAPSFLIIFVLGLMGARLGGLLQGFSASLVVLGGLILLVPLGLWWLYRYVDWANDIFQVSPTHIIDIDKKPLGSEQRKVAPLENILGTEVNRKGLIGLLLNYGDVVANVGTTEFVFEDVFDPSSVQQDVVRAQEAQMLKSRQAEQRQRRDEMVELISAYHRELGSRGDDKRRGNRRPR